MAKSVIPPVSDFMEKFVRYYECFHGSLPAKHWTYTKPHILKIKLPLTNPYNKVWDEAYYVITGKYDRFGEKKYGVSYLFNIGLHWHIKDQTKPQTKSIGCWRHINVFDPVNNFTFIQEKYF